MKTIRSFLALKLNLDSVNKIAAAQKQMRDELRDSDIKVAWVPPPNMHITMCFLGDVTEPMVYAIEDMLRPLVARTPAFEVQASSLGVFPDLGHPRVIWAGTRSESNQLLPFHDLVSKKLAEAGFPTDQKAFRSHVTIGRVKGGGTEALASAIHQEDELFFGNTLIRNLICYRSDLKPKGAEYYPLWSLELGAPLRVQSSAPPSGETHTDRPSSDSAEPVADEKIETQTEQQTQREEQPPTETEKIGE